MKNSRKYLALLLSLMMLALAVPAAGLAEAALPVIKIATCFPLSGGQANFGETLKNGSELALLERVEEFKALGFDLQHAPQDDQADPKVGVTVAQRLIEDPLVLAVVGHYNSGVAIPSSEVYLQGGLPMVSPGNTATEVTDRGLPIVSRICARDDAQGPAGADFLLTMDLTTVFIISDKTAYGEGIAAAFRSRYEEKGGAVLGFEGITAGEADYSAVEEMARASGASAIYFAGTYDSGALLIRQLSEKAIDAIFLGPDGIDNSEVVNIAGDAVIGTYYTTVAADVSTTEAGAVFAADFKAKYGIAPSGFSAYGYDAMNVTLDAIKAVAEANPGATPTREQIAEQIRKTSGYKGLATDVTFNGIGDNTEASVYVMTYNTAVYPGEVIQAVPVTDFLK
ncbi:branched chain amino acid ABC transporter substrate-binding protein [Clostridia bacterium]|nr:branched chain amino acid ABC transporter substrate-binding protein [Clostridia bacterium]